MEVHANQTLLQVNLAYISSFQFFFHSFATLLEKIDYFLHHMFSLLEGVCLSSAPFEKFKRAQFLELLTGENIFSLLIDLIN